MISYFIIISFIFFIQAHIRFRDDEMMRQHHDHKSTNQCQQNQQEQFLQIHLIPHSHDDVGWLKTVDSYYYGANQTIQQAGVQYILDTVVQALLNNRARKFIFVEIAFFYRWWNEQEDYMKDRVKYLINNKQIEFINGGWCMNDEADTYYEDIIDQMTLGHQFLLEQFSQIPSIGWHIDPFGHQASQAAIFSQMGFNAMFFPRIDHQDKKIRMQQRSLELVWHPKQDSGIDHSIFTHINYWYYFSPPGFCFDQNCLYYKNNNSANDPVMDDPLLEYNNVKQRADGFALYFKNMSLHYQGQHLMHTMGFDFQYANAHMNFKNMDKLIKYINNHSQEYKMNITYSTPNEYIQIINAVQQNEDSPTYPTKNDDFLPYSDIQFAYWTGYYTSRAAQKGLIKELGRFLQNSRTLLAFLRINQQLSQYINQNWNLIDETLTLLEQVLAVNQHHDAVAGTEKQWVTDDYIFQLTNASAAFNTNIMSPFLQEQTKRQIQEQPKQFVQCNWNSTAEDCPLVYDFLLQEKPILVAVYNPDLSKTVPIRIKVPNIQLIVINQNNSQQAADIICANLTDPNDCDIFFIAQLKEYSLNYFKLIPTQSKENTQNLQKLVGHDIIQQTQRIILSSNRFIDIKLDKFLHTSCSSQNQNCQSTEFAISYNHYPSYQDYGQKSGAYIFRPANKSYVSPKSYSKILRKVVYQGNVVTVIHLIGELTDSFLRYYNLEQFQNIVELETFIKPIPVYEDYQGKEIVLDIDTDLDNNNTFYTDSNGLEMQQRIKNYRPTWQLQVNEPTSGNYYPVSTMIYIQDIQSSRRLTILNDRAQGGTSLEPGRIEIMLHRRLLYDDDRGVGEPLNELDYDQEGLRVRLRHFFYFGNNDNLKEGPRLLQKQLDLSPLQYYAGSFQSYFTNNYPPYTYLPTNIQFNNPFLKIYFKALKIQQQNAYQQQYLLRLHNLNEFQNATFFGKFSNIEEMTLTANQKKSEWISKQLKWKQKSNQTEVPKKSTQSIQIDSDGKYIAQ